jgi:hypothetical protein
MKCTEAEAIMIEYLDKTLDEKSSNDLEKHVETCEHCLDELKETQKVLQLMTKGEMAKPDESLRINFYHMLHSEIDKTNKKRSSERTPVIQHNRTWFRIAAGFALLICGTFLGAFFHSEFSNKYSATELKNLQTEVALLKQTAMFTMLNEESSADRLQAVNYANDLEVPERTVIDVLVKTLNNDKNVNVRMAAAYALAKFADQRAVCDSLVKSLSVQNDPILQVILINILVERKEREAIEPMRRIMNNETTLREVKVVAENGIRQLI